MLCNKCNQEIADNSKFCPNCGNNLYQETQIIIDKKHNSKILNFIYFIAFCWIFLFVLSAMNPDKKPKLTFEEDQYAQEILARTLCQQNIPDLLSNPKSADFQRNEDVVTKIANMNYHVASSLYTQNLYGGTVKLYYSCDVLLTDENHGIVSNIQLK